METEGKSGPGPISVWVEQGVAGNCNQKVFAGANYVTESDCSKALHPNVYVVF